MERKERLQELANQIGKAVGEWYTVAYDPKSKKYELFYNKSEDKPYPSLRLMERTGNAMEHYLDGVITGLIMRKVDNACRPQFSIEEVIEVNSMMLLVVLEIKVDRKNEITYVCENRWVSGYPHVEVTEEFLNTVRERIIETQGEYKPKFFSGYLAELDNY